MFIGAVKWFDNIKGYGMLAAPMEGNLFVHIRGFTLRPKKISPGEVVIGQRLLDVRKGRMNAHHCHLAAYPADWITLMTLLGKPDKVVINSMGPGHNSFSLLELAIPQFLSGKDIQDIMLIITHYFEQELKSENFIEYARVLEKTIPKSLGQEDGNLFLKRIFAYFGSKVSPDVLFSVWKKRKFKYIGYSEKGDYEIPRKILDDFATMVTLKDLNRIHKYTYGPSYCANLATAMLENADGMNQLELDSLTPCLDFLEGEDKEIWKSHLEQLKTE
ncbi:'Cold-shock' DNA-binding domain-containing protein [bacterium A37T11]|nr:'Cold-shock' DNA-binding domain-containing protein [bacterium A37T11]